MKSIENFLFASLPWAIVHFLLFKYVWHWLGYPGFWVASTLGATRGGILWWAIMVLNSLFWSGCLTLIVLPVLRRGCRKS